VLLNAYSSTIISYLTAPKLMPVAKSLEDVVLGIPKHLKLLVEKDLVTAAKYLVRLNSNDSTTSLHIFYFIKFSKIYLIKPFYT